MINKKQKRNRTQRTAIGHAILEIVKKKDVFAPIDICKEAQKHDKSIKRSYVASYILNLSKNEVTGLIKIGRAKYSLSHDYALPHEKWVQEVQPKTPNQYECQASEEDARSNDSMLQSNLAYVNQKKTEKKTINNLRNYMIDRNFRNSMYANMKYHDLIKHYKKHGYVKIEIDAIKRGYQIRFQYRVAKGTEALQWFAYANNI